MKIVLNNIDTENFDTENFDTENFDTEDFDINKQKALKAAEYIADAMFEDGYTVIPEIENKCKNIFDKNFEILKDGTAYDKEAGFSVNIYNRFSREPEDMYAYSYILCSNGYEDIVWEIIADYFKLPDEWKEILSMEIYNDDLYEIIERLENTEDLYDTLQDS